ncbi:MAG TPA: heavy metal-binding domain-containing protein [Ignavibacteriaceae bacterium]|nr:heavy metal-binding domain-containing protein [Ignavibacteriaceae bacterium]
MKLNFVNTLCFSFVLFLLAASSTLAQDSTKPKTSSHKQQMEMKVMDKSMKMGGSMKMDSCMKMSSGMKMDSCMKMSGGMKMDSCMKMGGGMKMDSCMKMGCKMKAECNKEMGKDSTVKGDKPFLYKGVIDLKSIDLNKDGKVYQCPMDFNVLSDKPGIDPKCGMELKEVTLKQAKNNLIMAGLKVK